MSPILKEEQMEHFEKAIYLPMILTILHKDQEIIDATPFKLKRPYKDLVDQAIKIVENEYRETRILMKKKQYKILPGTKDNTFTEYVFYYEGYEDHRKYMNFKLRNRTEELIRIYLMQGMLKQ